MRLQNIYTLNDERERILLLTNNRNALRLFELLTDLGESVFLYSGVLSEEQIMHMNPKIIVSYNYSHIIDEKIISMMNGKIINLHISFLPWNKGSDPNFWSFIENTPKGVMIHKVDAHLDTGMILCQRELYFDEGAETFRTTYEKLNDAIVNLFCENWNSIKNNAIIPFKQSGEGTYHKRSDFKEFVLGHPFNYDDKISDYKNRYNIQ